MTDGQQIREQMWDYVYGLLSEEECQEMVARIKSDPQLARLYAEVRLKGELVAQAALVEDSSLQLKADPKGQPQVAQKQAAAGTRSSAFWHERATQLIALAAGGLIVILGTGLCWPRTNAEGFARNFVATDVVALESLPAGLTNQLALHTYHVSPAGEAAENASAEVQLRLIDSFGKEQFQKTLRTNASGQANVEIPGAALEPGTRLEVNPSRASAKGQSVALTTELPVEPEPEITYFLSKEPVAEPPADAAGSTWNFAAFSAKPIPENQSQITGGGGEFRSRDVEQRRGGAVVNGYVQLTNRAAGRTLAQTPAKSLVKQEAAASPPTQVVEAGQPVQVDILPQLANKSLDVAVLCRGVTVAATSENETPSAQENSKESSTDEAKLADRKAKIGQRQITVPLPPEADGLMEVEIYDQNSNQPEPVQRNLVYRQPLRKLVVELPDFRTQVAPGDDVELKLHVVDETGNPAANTRVGVRVWNEPLVRQLGDRPLLLIDAVLNGQGFDYGQNAQVAANQQGQQPDLRRLKQQANNYQRQMRAARAAPPSDAHAASAPAAGALVQDRQLNESQQFARIDAVASIKVELASNRDAVKLAIRNAADESAARRERAMRILGGVSVLGGIAVLLIVAGLAALKLTANVRVLAVPLATALASLLIGIAWLGVPPSRSLPTIAMAAPAASKNAPVSDMASVPAAAESARLDLREESQSHAAGGPAPLSASAAPQSPGAPGGFAFAPGGAPNTAKPTEPETLRLAAPASVAGFGAKAAPAEKKDTDKDSNPTVTPPSLYFDPNLITDDKGDATIRLKMPAVPCEYRLLIDALGNGRIGSRQELLSCSSPSN
ncbi:MAG TPA: hypothetical protein VGI40_18990 [Pirellulaceae bacterium]|jgi:hypothetical protein